MARAVMIHAPAKGWIVPLDKVPDPAFASGALGDGLAIELLDDTICAPCDATIAAVASSRHAMTLETEGGAQILIHCGIDTVALDGAPFTVLVEEGASVAAGDPVMRVDLDLVVRAGKSLATPIVLIEPAGHRLSISDPASRLCDSGTALFSLAFDGEATNAATRETVFTATRELVLPLPHGLHARPAAAIAAEAARWNGPIGIVLGERSADARSTTALMKLGAVHQDRLTIRAGGDDADAAVDAVAALIESGAGDEIASAPPVSGGPVSDRIVRAEPRSQRELPAGTIGGVPAAPGEALGPAYYLHRARLEVTETSRGVPIETARLTDALEALRAALTETSDGAGAGIAIAHRAILDDSVLIDAVHRRIANGDSAAVAWQGVMQEEADALRELPDARLAERADDFADLEQQLLRVLTGNQVEIAAPADAIVIAKDLYPSDLAPLAAAGIAGIATMDGGPTSHLAILAASADLPMAVAFGKPLCEVEEGEPVYLSGDDGSLQHRLTDEDRSALVTRLERRARRHARALDASSEDTYLASGERIEVFANLGSVEDAEDAIRSGAEGSGLLRTEFLFLDRASPPDEEEQAAIYKAIMDRFDDKPVIIRTLDIGADKPAPYLPLEAEDNPALGVRGIRIALRYPELLSTQLRAIIRAAGERTAYIMAPMVGALEEIEALREMLDSVIVETGHATPVKLGAMIETPASALIAPALIARLDFLSVGTNDLTQYTLAVDRTNPELAQMLDPMHPAVLRLIEMTGGACKDADRLLGVCGSAAGDHIAAAVLVGLGVTELSTSAARIPELKQHLRCLTHDQCREAARIALQAATAESAREAASRLLTRKDEE